MLHKVFRKHKKEGKLLNLCKKPHIPDTKARKGQRVGGAGPQGRRTSGTVPTVLRGEETPQ